MNGHAPVAELLLEAGAEKDLCSLRGGADDGNSPKCGDLEALRQRLRAEKWSRSGFATKKQWFLVQCTPEAVFS